MPCMVYRTCTASHTYSSDSLFWLVSMQYMCKRFGSMLVLTALQKRYQQFYITFVVVRSTFGVYLQSSSRAFFNPPSSASLLLSTLLVNHVIMTVITRSNLITMQQHPSSLVLIELVCTNEVLLHAMGRCCLPRSVCAILP